MSDTATVSAPAPVAPSNVSTSPAAGLSLNQVMSKVAGNTSVQDAPVPEQPVIKIVKEAPAAAAPSDTTAPVAETPAVEATPASEATTETPAAEPEAVAVSEPQGELSVDDGELVLRAERNADGTYKTKIDPTAKHDFEIKDKESGEVRKYSKTVPELMRLSKDAIALQPIVQKLKPEVEYYRAKLPEWQQQITDVTSQLEAQQALNRELLTADPSVIEARRQQYAQEMSPEKRLARLEQERAQETETRVQEQRREQHLKVANAFIQSRIDPAIAKAEGVVGVEATAGKVMLLTNDLMVQGVIPPANWPEMERRINAPDGPFQAWLSQESAKRSQSDSELQRKRAEADEAKRRAQQAVNDTGRSIAPIGRAGADTPPVLPKAKNQQEVMQRLVNRPLPNTITTAVGTG